jgi:hypothetical protein
MLPVLALVGRPNVGKSTLFNALTGTRDALVADIPGLTRDRKYGYGHSEPYRFIVVDTGGGLRRGRRITAQALVHARADDDARHQPERQPDRPDRALLGVSPIRVSHGQTVSLPRTRPCLESHRQHRGRASRMP